MKNWFFLLALITLPLFAGEEKIVKAYENSAQTFFCGCEFVMDKMQLRDSGCISSNFIKSPIPESVQWTYLIPETSFTADLQCWHEPHSYSECVLSDNKPMSSTQCCNIVSAEYRQRTANIHNLVPIVDKFISYKEEYRLGQVYNQKTNLSNCSIQWDEQGRRLEPPDKVKGDIARVYFYFESMGYIHLSHRIRPLMEIWDMKDPVSEVECQLQAKKAALSGFKNPYVANRCR